MANDRFGLNINKIETATTNTRVPIHFTLDILNKLLITVTHSQVFNKFQEKLVNMGSNDS